MMSFKILFIVGTGGFLGAILRYLISQISLKFLATGFGTLIVNILGGFLIGLVMAYSNRFSLDSDIRLFIVSGFLGALTTFSTFTYDNITFIEQGQIGIFFINIMSNVFLSILACYAGILVFK